MKRVLGRGVEYGLVSSDAHGECNGFSGWRKVVVSGGPSGVGGLNCWFCLNGCVHPPLLHLRVHPQRCFSGRQIGKDITYLKLHKSLVTYP